ncbi:MAG: rRNA adenine N-6-methyltransferase family protein, partial [Chlamydiia bacterium]
MGRYLGQHFLTDATIIDYAISSFFPLNEGILEVGPGAMALTERLLEHP